MPIIIIIIITITIVVVVFVHAVYCISSSSTHSRLIILLTTDRRYEKFHFFKINSLVLILFIVTVALLRTFKAPLKHTFRRTEDGRYVSFRQLCEVRFLADYYRLHRDIRMPLSQTFSQCRHGPTASMHRPV